MVHSMRPLPVVRVGAGYGRDCKGDVSMSNQATARTAHEIALAARHAEIEARIAQENARPHPDNAIIAQLKKTKLRIKDSLAAA